MGTTHDCDTGAVSNAPYRYAVAINFWGTSHVCDGVRYVFCLLEEVDVLAWHPIAKALASVIV